MLVAALIAGLRLRRRAFVPITAAFVAFVAMLSVPTLLLAGRFLERQGSARPRRANWATSLHPLSELQVAGIWPVGDFRGRPADIDLTYVLIGVVAVGALAGLYWAWRRRQWALVLFVAGTATGCAITVAVGSPWVDGKALAIASPAALVGAMAAIGWFCRHRAPHRGNRGDARHRGRRGLVERARLPRCVAREAKPAARARGDREAVLGRRARAHERVRAVWRPAFPPQLDAESASRVAPPSDPAPRRTGVAKGSTPTSTSSNSTGSSSTARSCSCTRPLRAARPRSTARVERTLLRRLATSGAASNPHHRAPSARQRPRARRSGAMQRGAATRPRRGGCQRPHRGGGPASVTVVNLARPALPDGWLTSGDTPGVVYPSASGTLETTLTVPADGRYGFWLAGSFQRAIDLSVDGRKVSTAQNHLNHPGVDTPLGEADLTAGRHEISLHYERGGSQPWQRRPAARDGTALR